MYREGQGGCGEGQEGCEEKKGTVWRGVGEAVERDREGMQGDRVVAEWRGAGRM